MEPVVNGRIAIQKQSIQALFRHIDSGRFAVPKLQREFVWDGRKAAKLFDSIYFGMPIGIPLIWRAKRSQKLFLRQRYHVLPAFNHANREVWFLVDGQQRLSSLYNVKEANTITNARGHSVNFERVVLTLDPEDGEERIRYRKPVRGSSFHWRMSSIPTGITRLSLQEQGIGMRFASVGRGSFGTRHTSCSCVWVSRRCESASCESIRKV